MKEIRLTSHALRERFANGNWFSLCGRRFRTGRYGDAPPTEKPTCASCRKLLEKRDTP